MRILSVLVAACLLGSCVVHRLAIEPLPADAATPFVVESPVKAHLHDGTTIVFATGVTVADRMLRGSGEHYGIDLQLIGRLTEVPVDRVAAMESYQTPVNTAATGAASIGSGAGILVGVSAALLLIFGSCPTVYTPDAGPDTLPQAELFSYSIAPALQGRDIDRLDVQPEPDGRIRLSLRNEMLETHYIDHLELLEVHHRAGERAVPDQRGRPLLLPELLAPTVATDNTGRDVLASVTQQDDIAWQSTTERLANVDAENLLDHIMLEFPAPPAGSRPALYLRMRNSLMNTVLFYNQMLETQGYAALDWMANDLDSLSERVRLGLWYRKHMGMTVAVLDDGRWRKVGRIGDQGPIAWSERTIRLPRVAGDTVRVRLSFVADNWRVDQVALAASSRRGKTELLPVTSARSGGERRPDISAHLAQADQRYLTTRPGDHVELEFASGPATTPRTWFIAAEGYYQEWMRTQWLEAGVQRGFRPDDATLLRTLEQYAAMRPGLRERFETIRVPTQ